MEHHQPGVGIEALHKKAAFLVGGEVERAPYPVHTAGLHELLGGAEELPRYLGALLALQETEEAGLLVVVLVVGAVHRGAYPAHGPAVFVPGQVELHVGVLVEWVLRAHYGPYVHQQRGNPVGVALIDTEGQHEELPLLPTGFNLFDGHGHLSPRSGRGGGPLPGTLPALCQSCRRCGWPCSWFGAWPRRDPPPGRLRGW